MNTSPTLLVVTPTLGTSPYLNETIASVAALELPSVIHVLAAPADRIAGLQSRFPQLRVVPDAGRAGGIYGALNAALEQTPPQWDWFTYINDDDLLLPGFGAVARQHFQGADPATVTYGDVELIDERGRRTGVVTVERHPARFPALLQAGISPLMQQGMLFHRHCVARLSGFEPGYRNCADLDFWLRAFASGEHFRYYPAHVAQFRLRAGQLSGNTAITIREQDAIVHRLLPLRRPARERHLAVLRYRLANFPRYLLRLRHRGLVTSYGLLESSR